MGRRDLKFKRTFVIAVTLIMILIMFIMFVVNVKTRSLVKFCGYSSLIVFLTMMVANVWLGEDTLKTLDMPGDNLNTSPITVIFHIPFIFFLGAFIVFSLLNFIQIAIYA